MLWSGGKALLSPDDPISQRPLHHLSLQLFFDIGIRLNFWADLAFGRDGDNVIDRHGDPVSLYVRQWLRRDYHLAPSTEG